MGDRSMGEKETHTTGALETVAVLGAGTMGHGIAQVAAQAGHRVLLHDPSPQALAQGMSRIRANLEKVDPGTRDQALARIATVETLEAAVDPATLVIEAAPERMEVKRAIFQAVEAAAGPTALLATNTSSLSIDLIADGLERPERFLGLHFFNPVHIMALVEVVHGPRTASDILEQGVAFARGLGKEPIVVRDSPGFASSRLEEGVASAEDIDRAMELGYRHPMGPLRLTDLVGLDVRLGIAEYLHGTLGQDHFRPPQLLRTKVSEGKLGKKSGEGFYRWSD
jgi:3-hydroxybutyryl-CoA dehydrogenase